jgi:putative protein kinase ArgK-like GTPase of G3E family
VGVTGTTGAGKTTLIHQLSTRLMKDWPKLRWALVSQISPTANESRAHASPAPVARPPVSIQSFPAGRRTNHQARSLRAAVEAFSRSRRLDLLFIEASASGKPVYPFGPRPSGPALDALLFVTAPDAATHALREDSGLLSRADLVVLNGTDKAGARRAQAALQRALAAQPNPPPLYLTTTTRADDRGVNLLYAALLDLTAWEEHGGEKACHLRLPE